MPPIFEYQGFGYTAPRPLRGSFDTAASTENLGDIAATGANSVAITATYFMSSATASEIYEDPVRTETLEEVARAVDDAHAAGLTVLLKPHVDTVDHKPRMQIAPTDAEAWFADYKAMLLDYAAMAEAHGAEMLSLGTEIDGMTGATYAAYWDDIIASVRSVYSGQLTYGANWDGAAKVSFWDQMDVVGVDVYMPLSTATTPSMADLIAGWTRVSADPYYRGVFNGLSPFDYYQTIAQQTGKPLLITEVGYRSADGAAARPFDARAAAADPQEQADLYQAFFQVWSQADDWFKGAFLWHWSPLADPPAPTDYQTEGKPAEAIIRDWFSGNGTIDPAPIVDHALTGGTGRDTLVGGIGNDTIDGGGSSGGDSLAGGSGDDIFIVRNSLDRIGEFGNDGTDTVLTSLAQYTLPGNVENLGFIGSGGFAGTGNYHANALTGAGGNDTLDGGIAADTLNGAAGDDLLLGGSGIDVLNGSAGDDILDGGVERDLLDGSAGFDTARFSGATGVIRIDMVSPTEWQAVLPNRNVQQLLGIEAVEAPGGVNAIGSSGDDRITAGAAADTMAGGEGQDFLAGAGGSDSLDGGGGNDTLDGGAGSDALNGGAGLDTVSFAGRSAAIMVKLSEGRSYDGYPAAPVAEDTLSGIENLIGTAFGDYLEGDDAANAIEAGGGADIIWGRGGADLALGGDGNDQLYGEGGNDTLDGGAGNDTLQGGAGGDSLAGGAGTDTATYAGSGEGVSVNLLAGTGSGGDADGDWLSGIEHVIGSASADSLFGDGFANNLTGGAGSDTLDGGAANDTLQGGAGADSLVGGAGADTASYSSSTAAVAINLGTGAAIGGDAAGDTFNGIESLFGSGYGDMLTGDAFANMLSGLSGHDTLDGGEGNDTLDGGGGADRDVLIGGAGADSLVGGGGNDTITGGSEADLFFLAAASGADRITDFETGLDRIGLVRNVNGSGIVDGNSALARLSDDGLGNTVLDLGGGHSALLAGHAVGDFSTNDFWFA